CRMCRCSGKGRSLIEGHVRERILDDARRRRGSTLFAQVSTQVCRCDGHTTFIEHRGPHVPLISILSRAGANGIDSSEQVLEDLRPPDATSDQCAIEVAEQDEEEEEKEEEKEKEKDEEEVVEEEEVVGKFPKVRNSMGAVVSENRPNGVATVAELIGSVPVRDHGEPGATVESRSPAESIYSGDLTIQKKKGSEYGIPEDFADSIRVIRRSTNLSCSDSFGGVSLAIDNNKAML
ncbi:hypothetical protein ALC62_04390, partial [Cyphomyrmex costatus]